MKFFWILTCAVLQISTVAAVWGDSYEAEPGQFPYYVYVEANLDCGGSLIAPDVVLTAAHCLGSNYKERVDAGEFQVLVGAMKRTETSGALWLTVTDVKIPGKTTTMTLDNISHSDYNADIALLKLEKAVVTFSPIELVLNMNDAIPEIGDDLTMCGLGRGNFPNNNLLSVGYPEFLHYATSPFKYTRSVCNSGGKASDGVQMWEDWLTPRQMCWSRCWTKNEVCHGTGDDGGPVVKIDGNIHTLVGVVSTGSSRGKKPDILASVSRLCEFFQDALCTEWQTFGPSSYLCSSTCIK